jgi:hypothetical protein
MTANLRPSRWLRLALGTPVAGGLFLLAWYGLVLDVAEVSAALLGGAFVLVMARLPVRRFAPRAARAISVALWAVATAAWASLTYPAMLIAPVTTLAFLAAAAAAYLIDRWERWPRWSAAGFLLIAAFAATAWQWHPLLLALPLAGAVALWTRRWKPAWQPHGLRWLTVLWVAMLGAVLTPFYVGALRVDIAPILSQPGVSAIYAPDQANARLKELLGDSVRLGEADCNGEVLVGNREGGPGLVRLTANGVQVSELGPVSDYIALDCARGRIAAGQWDGGDVVLLDHDSLRTTGRVTSTRLSRVSGVMIDPATGAMLASADDAKRLVHIAPDDLAVTLWEFPHFVTDWFYDAAHTRLTIAAWGGGLWVYALPERRLVHHTRAADFLVQLTPEPGGDAIWVARFTTGRLARFDPALGRVTAEISLEPGIRFGAFSPGGMLHVGNFFSGELTTINTATLQVVARRNFGPRLRDVNYDTHHDRLLVAAAAGLFGCSLAGR